MAGRRCHRNNKHFSVLSTCLSCLFCDRRFLQRNVGRSMRAVLISTSVLAKPRGFGYAHSCDLSTIANVHQTDEPFLNMSRVRVTHESYRDTFLCNLILNIGTTNQFSFNRIYYGLVVRQAFVPSNVLYRYPQLCMAFGGCTELAV